MADKLSILRDEVNKPRTQRNVEISKEMLEQLLVSNSFIRNLITLDITGWWDYNSRINDWKEKVNSSQQRLLLVIEYLYSRISCEHKNIVIAKKSLEYASL